MHIDNLRKGHACNSSSSHSFIIPDGSIESDEFAEFGWQGFTVAPEDIEVYLAANIWSQKSYKAEESVLVEIRENIKQILGVDVDEDSYVDHQSHLTIPRVFGGDGFNWDYVRDMHQYLKSKGVGVAGGNDNDGPEPAFSGTEINFPGPVDADDMVGRKTGGQWVLFNPRNGNRTRVRFDDSEPYRPESPELVDMKITDFCDMNCGYCYQGSTKEGKHAIPKDVFSLLSQLAEMEVFEVAIGGGEATQHPQFMQFCEYARYLGIVPNLTTRNHSFVRDNYKWCADILGAIAISADSEHTVRRAAALRDLSDGNLKFNIQIVCGGCYGVDRIIEETANKKLALTLLGFKEQERGNGFRQIDYSKWNEAVAKHFKYGFNVDTAFLKKHERELRELVGSKFSKYALMYEGLYSCYIDAVAMQIAPSSFCDKNLYLDIGRSGVKSLWSRLSVV